MSADISTLLTRFEALNLKEVLDHEKFNEFSITHHSTSYNQMLMAKKEPKDGKGNGFSLFF